MRILAFDTASRVCGWCGGPSTAIPTAGVWTMPDYGERLGAMGSHARREALALIQRFEPDVVLLETPILRVKKRGVGFTDSVTKLRKLYGVSIIIEQLCDELGIECREETVQAIKKELTGQHDAPKAEMVRMAQRLGVVLPSGTCEGRKLAEDAADSLGLWLLGVRMKDKSASAHWDRALYTRRGALI